MCPTVFDFTPRRYEYQEGHHRGRKEFIEDVQHRALEIIEERTGLK